ncbi:MAG: cyclic nucleotide-binding domain-containing protein [Burkholderiales bacterium]
MRNATPASRATGLRLAGSGPAYRDALCEMLDGVELFSGLPWPEIETLSAYVTAHEADPGHVLFREGMPGDALYVLIRGLVETRKDDGTQHAAVIATESAGRSIGEMALIDGEPRSASCVVAEASLLLALTRDNFQRLAERHPALALRVTLRIARLMSRRLRATSGRLVEFLDT